MPHPSITAQTDPHRPAIIMGGSGETVTYRELDDRSNQGAQLFRSLGIGQGDHIGMMLENTPRFLEICWAAQRAGIVFTPIATHLRKGEAAYILNNCGAKLFVGSANLASVSLELLAATTTVEHFYMAGGIREGFQSWEEALEHQPAVSIEDPANGVAMVYSSGTTGQPKGVFLRPSNTEFDAPHMLAESVGTLFDFSPETVYLSPAPLYHAAPLHYTMLTIYQGGTCVIMEKFDPETALQLIEKYRVTHSQWVPIMFIRMLKQPREIRDPYDLSCMRFVIHAAAPCPIETKQKMIQWWGPVITEYYGSSENIGVTVIDSEDWLQHKGSVGKVLYGELHILDEAGNELPPGETGAIYFGGERANFRYHGEPEKTAGAYNERGWATTGDVGHVDEDGYLYLTDRKHFMIISGGVNIYPQEVENQLITHEQVADVAVFGIPNDEFGEEVKAVVQPVDWADANEEFAAELSNWLRQRLSHLKVPKSIDFRQELPRMDNGKLYKQQLMDEYRIGTSSQT